MKSFRGGTALVTGASAGIGREIARQLGPEVATMILVARRLDRLEELASSLMKQSPGLTVHCRGVDLASEFERHAFGAWLSGAGLQVDLLVNNAGLGDHGPFATGDWDRVRQMLEVNIAALTHFTHQVLPSMRSRRRGAILNISSTASLVPVPNMAVYAASKAYVTSLSEALRAELRDTGISVTTVCPGPVETEFNTVARRRPDRSRPHRPDLIRLPVERVAWESIEAVRRDRARVIPGILLCIAMTLAACVPLFALRLALNRIARMER